jgi:hypothetical protein
MFKTQAIAYTPVFHQSYVRPRKRLMKPQAIPPLIATCILALAMIACNLGNTSNATQAPATNTSESTVLATEAPTMTPDHTTGACDNPYLPVIVGATWKYKLTGPFPDTYTHTVLSVGDNSFSEQDVFSKGITRQGNWNCDHGNLTALNPPSGSSGTVASKNIQVDLHTKSVSGVSLPATINAGDTWTQALDLEGTETINGTASLASNNLTYDCKASGVESVTVAAGTFDAMRVDCTTVAHVVVQMSNNPVDTTLNLTTTSWYVNDVGVVKSLTSGLGIESTVELISYTIPK